MRLSGEVRHFGNHAVLRWPLKWQPGGRSLDLDQLPHDGPYYYGWPFDVVQAQNALVIEGSCVGHRPKVAKLLFVSRNGVLLRFSLTFNSRVGANGGRDTFHQDGQAED